MPIPPDEPASADAPRSPIIVLSPAEWAGAALLLVGFLAAVIGVTIAFSFGWGLICAGVVLFAVGLLLVLPDRPPRRPS